MGGAVVHGEDDGGKGRTGVLRSWGVDRSGLVDGPQGLLMDGTSGGRGAGKKPRFGCAAGQTAVPVRDGDTGGGGTDWGAGERADIKLLCRHGPPVISGPLALAGLTPQTWKHAL